MPVRPAHPVLIFDGDCALCSRTVRFLVNHEHPAGLLRFAPLQSDAGRELLSAHGFSADAIDTVVLIEPVGLSADARTKGGATSSSQAGSGAGSPPGTLVGPDSRVFVRSAAVLRLAAYLRAPRRWARLLRVIPAPLLDVFYRLLARHRLTLFGSADRCTPDDRVRARTL